jgi:hypothetical protein
MLQRNSDGNRGQRRDFFPQHPVHAGLRRRDSKSRDMADRLSINYGRQGGSLHLAGDIDVVSRVGLRKVLTIFRECGKPGDGYQQKQCANFQAKPPVRCSVSKQAFRLWVNVHAQAQAAAKFRNTDTAFHSRALLLHLTVIRIQKARIGM